MTPGPALDAGPPPVQHQSVGTCAAAACTPLLKAHVRTGRRHRASPTPPATPDAAPPVNTDLQGPAAAGCSCCCQAALPGHAPQRHATCSRQGQLASLCLAGHPGGPQAPQSWRCTAPHRGSWSPGVRPQPAASPHPPAPGQHASQPCSFARAAPAGGTAVLRCPVVAATGGDRACSACCCGSGLAAPHVQHLQTPQQSLECTGSDCAHDRMQRQGRLQLPMHRFSRWPQQPPRLPDVSVQPQGA